MDLKKEVKLSKAQASSKRKPFVAPKLTLHSQLPKVTNGFGGSFTP